MHSTSISLSFVEWSGDDPLGIRLYPLTNNIRDELFQLMDLPKDAHELIFSFGRFSEFKIEKHTKILDHMFQNVSKNILRIEMGGPLVSYKLAQPDSYLESLPLDDLIFLCGIFHNLNVKKYLMVLTHIILSKHQLSFEQIVQRAKSDTFKMTIYCQ